MATIPGLLATPTVLLNLALGFVPDRSLAVRSSDRLAVLMPMYNEEAGAGPALRSVLTQRVLPDRLAISINGGSDRTPEVVANTLCRHGFRLDPLATEEAARRVAAEQLEAEVEVWRHPSQALRVTVLRYREPQAKSASLNALVRSGLAPADRYLLVDGDTVLEPEFVANLRENFYRLHIGRRNGRREIVLEDYGLQSGTVTSRLPFETTFGQRLVSAGREAEYAFATVLRRGQARRLGRGELWGRSRLFTVVGCGFVARSDLFPMPVDTRTEDHDFTQACQNAPLEIRSSSPAELSQRGLRVVVGGQERSFEELFDRDDPIVVRRGGNARFVPEALMATDDPPHLDGFMAQVERWNGGALENALKRLGKPLAPNVAFSVWSSQIEDVLGLLLLLLAPLAMVVRAAVPGAEPPLAALLAWLAADVIIVLAFATLGFYLRRRTEGATRRAALGRCWRDSVRTLLPFLLLKYLNPFTYLASASEVIPAYLRQRRARARQRSGVVWERPRGRTAPRTRAVLLGFGAMLPLMFGSMQFTAARLEPHGPDLRPVAAMGPSLVGRALSALPGQLWRTLVPVGGSPTMVGAAFGSLLPSGPVLSAYCDPVFLRAPGESPRRLQVDPARYQPLGRGELLTLARLAPLAATLEAAATAYDVPARFLLKVLINESYLDPLAVGPSNDYGLSQLTADAVDLLRAISHDGRSRFYNPRLFRDPVDPYDPDFSICAGAAKLAWATEQPDVDGEREAYALYINPQSGLVDGAISDIHLPLTEAMERLERLATRLAAVYSVYREDPERLTATERRLVEVTEAVRAAEIGIDEAYQRVAVIVREDDIPDRDFYLRVLGDLYRQTHRDVGAVTLAAQVDRGPRR